MGLLNNPVFTSKFEVTLKLMPSKVPGVLAKSGPAFSGFRQGPNGDNLVPKHPSGNQLTPETGVQNKGDTQKLLIHSFRQLGHKKGSEVANLPDNIAQEGNAAPPEGTQPKLTGIYRQKKPSAKKKPSKSRKVKKQYKNETGEFTQYLHYGTYGDGDGDDNGNGNGTEEGNGDGDDNGKGDSEVQITELDSRAG